MKISVIANCQSSPVASLLNLSSDAVEICRVPPVHTIPPEDRDEIAASLSAVDVVVHQPISDRFGALSSEALKKRYPHKQFLSFPSIFFGGFTPQVIVLRDNGKPLKGPLGDYHDRRIIDAYLAGSSVKRAAESIEDDDQTYEENFQEALEESSSREAQLDVKVMPKIMEVAAMGPPLHTMNHPANEVLWHVSTNLLRLLEIPLKNDARPPQRQYLGAISAAVPKRIPALAGGEWQRPNYILDGEPLGADELVERFYSVYSGLDFAQLVEKNLERFGRVARFMSQ